MPYRYLLFLTLPLLAACGTPQERCVARETRALRDIDGAIAEAEGNLARGFALIEVRVPVDYIGTCIVVPDGPPEAGAPRPRPQVAACTRERWVTETRRRSIDPAAERARLAGLQAERRVLAPRVDEAVGRCVALPDA